MQNNSLADTVTQDLAHGTMAKRDAVIRRAIDFKMGRTDWTPEEVKLRGKLFGYRTPDQMLDFVFDGVPMVRFYEAAVHSEASGLSTHLVATQHYRVLCPELEKYLEA